MANWHGSSRSNYFRVKDPTVFRQWAERLGFGLFERKDDATVFGIYGGASAGDGSWPIYDHDTDAEIDLPSELSTHLAEGQVAVLMEVGAEKLCYVTGSAWAINHLGHVIDISLGDIYREAARTFRIPESEITRAEY